MSGVSPELNQALNKLNETDLTEVLFYATNCGGLNLISVIESRLINMLLEPIRERQKREDAAKFAPICDDTDLDSVPSDDGADNPPPIETDKSSERFHLVQKKKNGRKPGFKVSAATREKMSRAKRRWWAQKNKNKK